MYIICIIKNKILKEYYCMIGQWGAALIPGDTRKRDRVSDCRCPISASLSSGSPHFPERSPKYKTSGPWEDLWHSALLPTIHHSPQRTLLLIQGQSQAKWQPRAAQQVPGGSWEGLGPGQQDKILAGYSHCCRLDSAASTVLHTAMGVPTLPVPQPRLLPQTGPVMKIHQHFLLEEGPV